LHGDVKVGYRSAALAHLGNLSARVGRTINFDPATLQIVDDDEANQLLGRKYRQSHWATPKSLV
jgi:cobalamin biosynthesis protein CobD/CbiB